MALVGSIGDGIAPNEDLGVDIASVSYTWKTDSSGLRTRGIDLLGTHHRVLAFRSTRIFEEFDLRVNLRVDFEMDGEKQHGECDSLIHFPPKPEVDITCLETEINVECDSSYFSVSFDG